MAGNARNHTENLASFRVVSSVNCECACVAVKSGHRRAHLHMDRSPQPDVNGVPASELRRRRLAFLARMRHDLRTPMNAIIGYGELLVEEAEDRRLQALMPDLATVAAEGREILALINDRLAIARLEAAEPLNIAAIGADLQAAMAPRCMALDDAIARLAENTRAEATAPLAQDVTRLAEASARLRVLAAQLADAPDAPEEGLVPETRQATGADASERGAAERSARVAAELLVVDDDPANRDLLRRQLTRLDYAVTLAENGVEALRRLREKAFDLVLLDLSMPLMDGFQVLKQMRADRQLESIPVVVLSASDDMHSVVRCIEMGAADHLSKPFDPVLLQTRIRATLAVRRLQAEHVTARAGGAMRPAMRPFEHEVFEELTSEGGGGIAGFLRGLLKRMRPYRAPMSVFVVLMLVSLAAEASLPLGFKFITDDALIPHNIRVLVVTVIVLLAALLVSASLQIISDLLYVRLATKVLNDIRFNMYRHLQRLSMEFYARVSAGTITSRFTSDLAAVENTVMLCLPLAMGQFMLALFSLGLLFALEWKLAVLAVLGIYISFRAEQGVEGRASHADSRMKELQAGITSEIQESIGAQPVVKMFGLQNMVVERFKHKMVHFYRATARACFLSYLAQRLPDRGIALFGVLIIAAGAALSFFGFLTIGELISFQILLSGLVTAIGELSWSIPHLLRAAGGMEKIEQLLNEVPTVNDAPGAVALPRPARDITFRDVTFGYSEAKPVLKHVTFTVKAGQFVLLVGPSGCGKSTVLNLLMRFYDPVSGVVAVDGQDIRSVTQESLRRHMSVVLQESFLFNASIRENIRMGKQDATDEQVEAAARTAGMHEIIVGLPGGYDMIVGERGGKLSGGQRQRLAIARAILSDPAILLMDEATSALDTCTAASLNKALEQVGRQRTVLSVTHRLDTGPDADGILVFQEGALVESGTHTDLMSRDGLYARLYRQQAASREQPT